MNLLFKEDWEETKERYVAWWNHEYFGRCALGLYAPKDNPPPMKEPEQPDTPEERWTNLDYISALGEYRNYQMFYGGEAFPQWDYGYPGNKNIAVFLGCKIMLDFKTGWIEPILTGPDIEYEHLAIDESNPWWKFTLELLRRAAKEAKGKSIPAVGAFGGCVDTLAHLRGTEQLLFDTMDRPEQVRDAEDYLMDMWIKVHETFYTILKDTAEGSTCWFALWSPGKFYAAQNDFSYMISKEMYIELFLPQIEKQTNYLDHCVYHVDGVGSFKHVDALCELPRLQALQILPGAGKPSPLHYMDVLKKVQSAGKNLHITVPPEEIALALKELSARGLFIRCVCETEEEARYYLKMAEKWSVDIG